MNFVHPRTMKMLSVARLGSLAPWESVRVRAIF